MSWVLRSLICIRNPEVGNSDFPCQLKHFPFAYAEHSAQWIKPVPVEVIPKKEIEPKPSMAGCSPRSIYLMPVALNDLDRHRGQPDLLQVCDDVGIIRVGKAPFDRERDVGCRFLNQNVR